MLPAISIESLALLRVSLLWPGTDRFSEKVEGCLRVFFFCVLVVLVF